MDSQPFATNNEPVIPAYPANQERTGPTQFSDNVTITKPIVHGVSTVAATGSNQGNAATVPAGYGLVYVTAADGTKGVVLDASLPVGAEQTIYNVAASALKIYPPSGCDFNDGTGDAEISADAKTPARVLRVDATTFAAFFL